jgi:hypothetical protein
MDAPPRYHHDATIIVVNDAVHRKRMGVRTARHGVAIMTGSVSTSVEPHRSR